MLHNGFKEDGFFTLILWKNSWYVTCQNDSVRFKIWNSYSISNDTHFTLWHSK